MRRDGEGDEFCCFFIHLFEAHRANHFNWVHPLSAHERETIFYNNNKFIIFFFFYSLLKFQNKSERHTLARKWINGRSKWTKIKINLQTFSAFFRLEWVCNSAHFLWPTVGEQKKLIQSILIDRTNERLNERRKQKSTICVAIWIHRELLDVDMAWLRSKERSGNVFRSFVNQLCLTVVVTDDKLLNSLSMHTRYIC